MDKICQAALKHSSEYADLKKELRQLRFKLFWSIVSFVFKLGSAGLSLFLAYKGLQEIPHDIPTATLCFTIATWSALPLWST